VFITALVHQLLHGGRLPVFEALAGGRIARARLAPQPDDAVPRFDYEAHLRALTQERRWPESTTRISELRLAIDYHRPNGATQSHAHARHRGLSGEWLLDLPLLATSYAQCPPIRSNCRAMDRARVLAAPWHRHLATLDPAKARRRTGRVAIRGSVHA